MLKLPWWLLAQSILGQSYNFFGKKIHLFCTHEGSGLSGTERDIAKAAKGADVKKGIAISGSNVDDAEAALKKWIQERNGYINENKIFNET